MLVALFKMPFEGIICSAITIKVRHLGLCLPFRGANETRCDMTLFRVHLWVGGRG